MRDFTQNLIKVVYLTYKWKTIIYLFYTTYINVDLEYYERFNAKVGKCGITLLNSLPARITFAFTSSLYPYKA